jgi:hypothetical protein
MRRAQIMLVIVALLATPLTLLATGMACETTSSSMLCCATHGTHPHGKGMMCPHGDPGGGRSCAGNSGKHVPQFGTIAPIDRTKLAAPVRLAAPQIARSVPAISAPSIASGFSSVPFEPPRA